MSERTLMVYRDASTVAEAVAQRTLLAILEGTSERAGSGAGTAEVLTRKRFDVGLTGGSDSLLSLQCMARNPLVESIDWSHVHFWWGDDRFSAPDSDDRNCLQARHAFLDSLVERGLLPEENIHEMAADTRTAAQVAAASDEENDRLLAAAAAAYERELIAQLGGDFLASHGAVDAVDDGLDDPTPAAQVELSPQDAAQALATIKPLDVLVLGMGPDGHFGSLFPGHDEINVTDRLAVGVSHSPKMPPLRVSLTAPFMARSYATWMMTKGEGKAAATAGVFGKRNNPEFPSSFADGQHELIWFTTPDTLTRLER